MTIQILSARATGNPHRITTAQVSELIQRLHPGSPSNSEFDFHLPEEPQNPLVMIERGALHPLAEMSHLVPQDLDGNPGGLIFQNGRNWNKYTYTPQSGLVFIRGDYPFAIVPIREGGQQQRFYAARRIVGAASSVNTFSPSEYLVMLQKGIMWKGVEIIDEKPDIPIWLMPDYLDPDTIRLVWQNRKS